MGSDCTCICLYLILLTDLCTHTYLCVPQDCLLRCSGTYLCAGILYFNCIPGANYAAGLSVCFSTKPSKILAVAGHHALYNAQLSPGCLLLWRRVGEKGICPDVLQQILLHASHAISLTKLLLRVCSCKAVCCQDTLTQRLHVALWYVYMYVYIYIYEHQGHDPATFYGHVCTRQL